MLGHCRVLVLSKSTQHTGHDDWTSCEPSLEEIFHVVFDIARVGMRLDGMYIPTNWMLKTKESQAFGLIAKSRSTRFHKGS